MGVVPAAIVILPSLPYSILQQTFLEHPPRVARRFAQVASWTFAYPIDENLHTHTHTHASGSTFRRLSLEYGNFAIYLINFCLFHIERERRKRYKRVVPNYFICHTHCHCQRDCNLAKIMLANKNGKRHKRPPSPLPPPSLSFFLFIYLYINVFLPVAPAAHFKLIVAIYSVFYMPEETHMLCILYRYTCIHPDVVYSYIAHSHARD